MSNRSYNKLTAEELDYVDDKTAALLLNTPHSARIILWVMVAFFILAVTWASWAEIDKVTVGQGKVGSLFSSSGYSKLGRGIGKTNSGARRGTSAEGSTVNSD